MIRGVVGMEAVNFKARMVAKPVITCPVCETKERLKPQKKGKLVRHTCDNCGHTTTVEIQ